MKTPFTVSMTGIPFDEDTVQVGYHGTVEVSSQAVGGVLRQLQVGFERHGRQALVGCLDPLDSSGRGQIEAEAEVDDRSDYEGFFDFRASAPSVLPGEFETAKRVRLPEVHSRSEPVIFIAAALWRCAVEQGFADSSVAAVISEYEAG